MKYIKTFESIRSEFPDMFPPTKPEDEPQVVPGFEDGTIDPEDDYVYNFDKNVEATKISDRERYKTFLKVVKERNFTETQDEIIINMTGVVHDYCMSITEFPRHMKEFLKTELIGKYILDGFVDVMEYPISASDDKYYQIIGIIEGVYVNNVDSFDCSALINFKLKDIKFTYNTVALDVIKIDKLKSVANKYNL
jgi:hypothetical protein